MHVVGAVGSGKEAETIARQECIELALIDLVLHDEHGTEVGRSLRNLCPNLKVIIYTREKSMVLASEIFREEKNLSEPSLQGYLLTRNISSSDYLLQVYRYILEFGHFIDPEVIRWHYQFAQLEKMTPREDECAFLISKGLGNSQIAERMVISRRRVENLINSLYQKFHILGEPGDPARRVILVESIRLLLGPRAAASELSLLIIEDQGSQRQRLASTFKGNPQFRLLATAPNGTTGVDLALRTRPDIVLVDIHLPDIDGFQVTRQILEVLPRTKVIQTSREESDLYREKAIETGAIAFIAKKSLSPDAIIEACDSSED
jgi:DNA-binding NarL/FixJ family response regulator